MKNLLRATLEDDEADYVLEIVTLLAGGEALTEREQLVLLLGVRFMQRREQWMGGAIDMAVAEAIGDFLNRPQTG
jgi:hypothetical protein